MTLFNHRPVHRIASGFYPDPTVCRTPQGTYLMVNSSFEFFPGLPIFESPDGEHWTKIGDALTRPNQFPYETMGNSQGIYAPTMRLYDGVYYLIVTNVNKGTMMLTSRDPHAGWSNPIWIEGWPGIDPSLFFDDDGTVYICGNESAQSTPEEKVESPGIYMSRIDVDSGTIVSARRCICRGITGSNPEGPHMYRRDGMYYLLWAEGGTEAGHMENIARSSQPEGPYEMYPGNPLITNRSTHLTLQSIGHCDCADFDAERTLMVFHGTRNNNEYPAQGWIGREPYSVWFEWRDGWPALIDQSYETALNGSGDALEQAVAWITPGIDAQGRYTVVDTVEGTSISISAIEQTFDMAYGAPIIGTRQTDFTCRFSATLTDPQQLVSGEAGLAVYANACHYLTLAAQAQGNRMIHLESSAYNAGMVSVVGSLMVADNAPLTLGVQGNDHGYTFMVTPAGSKPSAMGSVPGKVLAVANAGGFTGTVLGVYAHGSGHVVFDSVTYATAADIDLPRQQR